MVTSNGKELIRPVFNKPPSTLQNLLRVLIISEKESCLLNDIRVSHVY